MVGVGVSVGLYVLCRWFSDVCFFVFRWRTECVMFLIFVGSEVCIRDVCVCGWLCVSVSVSVSVCMCVCVSVCLCVCVSVCLCVCVSVCLCVA